MSLLMCRSTLAAAIIAICAAASFGQRASAPPGTVLLAPEDIPTGPQETTATTGKNLGAAVHQWGLISVTLDRPPPGASSKNFTPVAATSKTDFQRTLPPFVHTTQTLPAGPAPRLEFSALYIHPPLRLSEPLKFNVTMQAKAGLIDAWYPYAADVRNGPFPAGPPMSGVTWHDVLAGTQADGLTTTHPLWLAARAVEEPATLKVYKPATPGTSPDAPGTTEGEVFLFMRGQVQAEVLRLRTIGQTMELQIRTPASSTTLVHSWEIRADAADAAGEQQFEVRTITPAAGVTDVRIPPIDNTEVTSVTVAGLTAQLNEALVGQGLDPDEAGAMSRITIASMDRPGRYLFALLPQQWADEALPLHVSGSSSQAPVRIFAALARLPEAAAE